MPFVDPGESRLLRGGTPDRGSELAWAVVRNIVVGGVVTPRRLTCTAQRPPSGEHADPGMDLLAPLPLNYGTIITIAAEVLIGQAKISSAIIIAKIVAS